MATTLKETLAQLEALGNEKVRAQNSKKRRIAAPDVNAPTVTSRRMAMKNDIEAAFGETF